MTEPKSPEERPEMPAELAAFLGAAKELEAPSPDVRARLAARLEASIAALPDGGGPEGGGAPEATPPSWLAAKVPVWAVAAAFVVGASAGALAPRGAPKGEAVGGPVAPASVASVVPAREARETPALPNAPPTARVDDLPAAPPPSARPSSAAPSSPGPADLARERALLDVARTALGRSDGPAAEQACAEHERAFPRGALAEEREAIRVQALVLEGRAEEARARALRFQKAFPSSILVPAVLGAAGVSP